MRIVTIVQYCLSRYLYKDFGRFVFVSSPYSYFIIVQSLTGEGYAFTLPSPTFHFVFATVYDCSGKYEHKNKDGHCDRMEDAGENKITLIPGNFQRGKVMGV